MAADVAAVPGYRRSPAGARFRRGVGAGSHQGVVVGPCARLRGEPGHGGPGRGHLGGRGPGLDGAPAGDDRPAWHARPGRLRGNLVKRTLVTDSPADGFGSGVGGYQHVPDRPGTDDRAQAARVQQVAICGPQVPQAKIGRTIRPPVQVPCEHRASKPASQASLPVVWSSVIWRSSPSRSRNAQESPMWANTARSPDRASRSAWFPCAAAPGPQRRAGLPHGSLRPPPGRGPGAWPPGLPRRRVRTESRSPRPWPPLRRRGRPGHANSQRPA